MDWIVTLGLMGLVALGGVMHSATQNGLLHANATEPFLSRQKIDMGMTMLLASVVAFVRNHTWLGWAVAFVGLIGLLSGVYGDWARGRASRRAGPAAD